jgi:hypothetical protein
MSTAGDPLIPLRRTAGTNREEPMPVRHLYLIATAVIVACAPARTSSVSRSSNALTAEELAAFKLEGRTAYEVVSRLRPAWLRVRGIQSITGVTSADSSEFALVIVDGHPLGRISVLRDIQAYQLSNLRYYDPSESGGRFGTRGANGVIEVRLKGR